MKTKYILAASLMLLGLVSCDKFLDTLPDNRTDLDSVEKLQALLVTAYPSVDYLTFNEIMSDNNENIGDNNPYTYLIFDQIYSWADVTEDWFGCPAWVWENCYRAIASANQVILTIEDKGGAEATGYRAEMAEALLCRAFSHFLLVNTFCMNYNAETSETDLGVPYMTRAETTLNPKYERGTVAEVYRHIDEDIQAALPYVSDSYYKVPQYHFNTRAAYAFAARFYLFYEKWEEAERCADVVLGEIPSLRNLKKYTTITRDFDVWCNQFIDVSEKANLLMLGANSIYGRTYCKAAGYCEKYTHTRYTANNEDLFAANIWGNEAGFSSASL
ncbi:MAG: RagB/SusD family nutrient uptake outer membrane protein, partial [Bacteroidales bacterium]|nr:RagB/SusD family nutrient uptake outer membrane protein [Bacteroidales bacterium]